MHEREGSNLGFCGTEGGVVVGVNGLGEGVWGVDGVVCLKIGLGDGVAGPFGEGDGEGRMGIELGVEKG